MAVYNTDENLTPVLLSAMRRPTCFMFLCWSWSCLVLLQLVLTTTLPTVPHQARRYRGGGTGGL